MTDLIERARKLLAEATSAPEEIAQFRREMEMLARERH